MPSSGPCTTCKRRRIKCDGDWPTCQRCEKSKRECLRPSSNSLAIVSENKYAAGKTKRPRGPRLRKATATTVIQDLHSKALKNYLENHITPPGEITVDISGSLSACILAWQENGRYSRLVELALLSMALAVYAQTQSRLQASTEAFSIYHELLRLLQEQMARPTLDTTSIDASLLTVFLMGRCESVMHNTLLPDTEGTLQGLKSWSHHDGAIALLKLWHMHFKSCEKSIIVKQSRRGILKSLLLRRISVPDWLHEGEHFGEHGQELEYDRILVRLINVRWDMSHGQSLTEKTSWDDLRQEIMSLVIDLYNIKNNLPESYAYREHKVPSTEQIWFQTPILRVCSTPSHASLWAHILATRLVISSTNMTLLQSSSETSEEVEICSKILGHVATQLAATIPQCIGLVDVQEQEVIINAEAVLRPSQASTVVWPLSMAAGIAGYGQSLQTAFKSQLSRLGVILGDGVLQSVSADDWPSL